MQTQYTRSTPRSCSLSTVEPQQVMQSKLPKSTFYKWKAVAEMEIIDVYQLNHFQENNDNKDATKLLKVCKVTLMEELFVEIA